jgi:hypothetical protein
VTAGGFREVDDDLLADYLGGALDGTPQETEVARLVEADAAWARAYALLSPAVAEVRADLARWAEPAPQLPPELAERLAAALAAADHAAVDTAEVEPDTAGSATAVPNSTVPNSTVPNSTEPDSTVPDSTGSGRQPGGPASPLVVPTQGGSGPGRRPGGPSPADPAHGTPSGPGRRRRRWARRATPLALAAVTVVAVGLGLNQLAGNGTADSSGSAMDRPASAPEGAAPVRTTGPSLHSGTDYGPQTLGDASAAPTTKRQLTSSPAEQPGVDAEGGRRPAPNGTDQLVRLTDETALTTCLADVATEHGSAPLVVEVIDYAAFQGEQALVIRFTDASGARWTWVSGPECGVPGSGADTRYQARVG